MIPKFSLHINNTGQPGGLISSIHMNRSQAARVIKQNIINNCRCHLGGPDTNYSVRPYIDKASKIVGHKIPYYLANDVSFVEYLRLNGAYYWFREYERYKKNGRELEPSKDDGILFAGVALVSVLTDTDYCILWDKNFGTPSPSIMKKNSCIIDELNDSHYMLDKLVDGYMLAQSTEKLTEIYYSVEPHIAETHLDLIYREYSWL